MAVNFDNALNSFRRAETATLREIENSVQYETEKSAQRYARDMQELQQRFGREGRHSETELSTKPNLIFITPPPGTGKTVLAPKIKVKLDEGVLSIDTKGVHLDKQA